MRNIIINVLLLLLIVLLEGCKLAIGVYFVFQLAQTGSIRAIIIVSFLTIGTILLTFHHSVELSARIKQYLKRKGVIL